MLKESFTYQLASIAEEAIRPTERIFEQRFGLNVHELRVLRLINDKPGITFTRLAALTRFDRSATSRILSRLIKARLVAREIDEDDARSFRLHSTSRGVALRGKADPLSRDMEALILSALSKEEQMQFRAALDKLTGWLETTFPQKLSERFPEITASPKRRMKTRKDIVD